MTPSLVLAVIIAILFSDAIAMEPISQNPPIILGFRVESIGEAPEGVGPNLLDPNGWNILFPVNPDGCTIKQENGTITIIRLSSDAGCGISQLFGDRWARDARYLISFEVIEKTDKTEIYTEPDDSEFYSQTGSIARVITQPMVWIQPRGDVYPQYIKIKNIFARKLE